MSKHKCRLSDDFAEVFEDAGDVRVDINGGSNYVRLPPEEARRMAKKLKKYANKISPKEATIS